MRIRFVSFLIVVGVFNSIVNISAASAQSICTEYSENCYIVKQRVQRLDVNKFTDSLRAALARLGGGNPQVDGKIFLKQWDFIANKAKLQGYEEFDVIATATAQLGSTPRILRISMFGVSKGYIFDSDLWNEFLIPAPDGREPKIEVAHCNCTAETCINLAKKIPLQGTIVKQTGSLILELDQPICFRGTGNPDDLADALDYPGQVALHLAPTSADFSTLLLLVGSHVELLGLAFGRHTTHHMTPVLFDPVSWKIK